MSLLRSPWEMQFSKKHTRRMGRLRLAKQTEQFSPFTEYADNPAGFCKDILGVNLWGEQARIAESVRDHPRTTVSACYGSGKTFLAACLVLWWCYTRRPAMVVTTAPTGRQVRKLLWREIKKLWKKAKRRLPGQCLTTELRVAEDVLAMGFSSDRPNSVAGLHEAANVLFIEDEAAGMAVEVVEGFDGITSTEGARHLKIGNPICKDGPFWDSHNKPGEKERWQQFEISALDTPNVKSGKSSVPGLVSREWVEDKRIKWRETSPLWWTKVLGKFWVDRSDKVVPQGWVIQSLERFAIVPPPEGRPQVNRLAVDVAGGGQDETVLYRRMDRHVKHVETWQEPDLMVQARNICAKCKDLGVDELMIDSTGLGQGLWQRVLELQENGAIPGVEVYGIALQESAEDSDQFERLVDEIQFKMRAAFDPANPNAAIIDPEDRDLAQELPLRGWSIGERGKIKVQSKRELRREGIPSPDHADSVSMLYHEPKEFKVFVL